METLGHFLYPTVSLKVSLCTEARTASSVLHGLAHRSCACCNHRSLPASLYYPSGHRYTRMSSVWGHLQPASPFCCCKHLGIPGLFTHPCPLCFQLTLTIVRQTGGLGISIAGGKGSTPYKGDDEVSSCLVSNQGRVSMSSLPIPAILVSRDFLFFLGCQWSL